MDDSADVGAGDFFEVELPAVAFEDIEVGDGEVEILRGKCEFGGASVIDLVIEMAEAVDQRVEFRFVGFWVGHGSGPGFFIGEGFVGVGLFFEEVGRRTDEDEDDDGHHDKDQAARKRRARGVFLSLGGIWHGGGLAFWRTEINGFEISK